MNPILFFSYRIEYIKKGSTSQILVVAKSIADAIQRFEAARMGDIEKIEVSPVEVALPIEDGLLVLTGDIHAKESLSAIDLY